MRVPRPYSVLVPLILAALLSSCGNKGDLVRPTPPADQQQKPAAPDAAKPEPTQDATQH